MELHHASHVHYDFRLEAAGVLLSWAVPKGPTLDPKERRLAMMTEDHPLDYFDFEGQIPEGNYGAGDVIVWDWGEWELVEGTNPRQEVHKGKIKFRMKGKKLKGVFTLVKMKGKSEKDNAWLLLKENDDKAKPGWSVDKHRKSVKSGMTIEQVGNDPGARKWISNRAKVKVHEVKLPKIAQPMLTTLIDAPFDDPSWIFEIKWDGIRALVTVDGKGGVTAVSRNGLDLMPRFPELNDLATAFKELPVIVDGEVVTLDAEGKSSFQRLQNQMTRKNPITFVVFDVLFAQGRDLRKEPLEKRKEILESLLTGSERVLYSKHVETAGKALYDLAVEKGLEGIIGKRRDSLYLEKRTRDWVKIKSLKTQDCVICGYTEPRGARSGFGALHLGVYQKGKLRYVGHVGTGFGAQTIKDLMKRFKVTEKCPFDVCPKSRTPSHWIKPELVCDIAFTEWTDDGKMRHPTFLGLREDKSPRECTLEIAA
jgi:bifunctional non-homologous end joining protein LigD